MLGWRDIYANRNENGSERVFTVTFVSDRATQALEHGGVRAKLASEYAVALTPQLDQRDFLHRTACNSGPTLLFAIRQLSYEAMVLLQRQPTR
jgi:hypothetical protein